MNIAAQGNEHDKLSVWRLKSSWEWQLVSEVSYTGYEHPYIPLAISPFDAETVYFWSNDLDHQCLVSMNLRIGEFVFHGKLERRSGDGCILKSPEGHTFIQLAQEFSSFVLPKWLYRIPNTVTNNSRLLKPSFNPTFIWWPKTTRPNTFLTCTREQDELNNTWQNIKQKKSAKRKSSSSTAHRIAMANSFSMLEDN